MLGMLAAHFAIFFQHHFFSYIDFVAGRNIVGVFANRTN